MTSAMRFGLAMSSAPVWADLRDETNATNERITRLPETWRPLSKNTRRCRTHRFPYSVIYQLRSDEILIVAIVHLHRRLSKNSLSKFISPSHQMACGFQA